MRFFILKIMFTVSLFVGLALHAAPASSASLNISAKDGIGTYLTDDKGITLYLFKKDLPGKSACVATGGCLERWPIFLADKFEPVSGIDPAGISVITREDGKKQTTYKGLPLYYFFKDKVAGDTLGQGVNNVWFVVTP